MIFLDIKYFTFKLLFYHTAIYVSTVTTVLLVAVAFFMPSANIDGVNPNAFQRGGRANGEVLKIKTPEKMVHGRSLSECENRAGGHG